MNVTITVNGKRIQADVPAGQTLLQYDNVKFYGYLMDPEIVTNLDNYCDYIHHSGGVCREILARETL